MSDKNTEMAPNDSQKNGEQVPVEHVSLLMPAVSAVASDSGKTVPAPAFVFRCLAATFSVVRRAQPMLAVPIIGTKVCSDIGLLAQDAPLNNYYALGLLTLEMIAEAIEFFYPAPVASASCESESPSYQQLHELMVIAAHAHIDNIRGCTGLAASSSVSLKDKRLIEMIAIGLGFLIRIPGRLLLLYPGLKALSNAVYQMFQQLLSKPSVLESATLISGVGYVLVASSFVSMVARILIVNPAIPDRPSIILGVTHVDAMLKNMLMPILPGRFLDAIRTTTDETPIGIGYLCVSMTSGLFSALAPLAISLLAPFAICSRIASIFDSEPGDLSFNYVMYAACTWLFMSFVSLLCTLITLPELPSRPALGVILISLALPLSWLAARGHSIIDALDVALTVVWPVAHTVEPCETTSLRQSISQSTQYYSGSDTSTRSSTFFTQSLRLTSNSSLSSSSPRLSPMAD